MHYLVISSRVTHERLEDEVIIINVDSGAYYSGTGPAADLWSLISQGSTVDEASRVLAAGYGCDEQTVARDVDQCVAVLLERGLIRPATGEPPTVGVALPESTRGSWIAPLFDEYTDMWDLIRLDPIHDVGEAGWPQADQTESK